ncbi:MAG: sigma 54-interacting transcriptional regulator [Candidatus Acidiferrum sp.]
MNPRIIGVAGPFQDTVHSVPEGEVSLGRDSSNQVWFADAALSRRHCVLIRRGAKVVVRDLGSRNGTRVNGMPVDEQELQHGDQITVGASLLLFVHDDQVASAAESTDQNLETIEFKGIASLLGGAQFYPAGAGAAAVAETPGDSRHLNALLQFAAAIGRIRDRESMQWQLLGFLFDVAPAERGALLFIDRPGEISSSVTWDRTHGPEHPVQIPEELVRRAVRERRGLLVHEGTKDKTLLKVDSSPSGSSLCVPLMVSEKVLGAFYLDTTSTSKPLEGRHLQILKAVADIAALAIENLSYWEQLAQENQTLRAEINLDTDMIGNSPAMRRVFDFIRRVAPTTSTVLIQGESGTGKELVARAIHRNSGRPAAPFVAINCAAITESLLESELFGHEKGAFTGAVTQKRGKVEVADGGTLFLDEIGELAMGLQAKLLRVLQEREFERVGGTHAIPLDIRLVAASNRDLAAAVESGGFRRDLFYRLNVVTVTLPPLRERREDIAAMANHFVLKASRRCKAAAKSFSPEAVACMKNYDWPGNVRELENAVERALVLGASDAIQPEDLPDSLAEVSASEAESASFHGAIKELKKRLIVQAFEQADGNYIDAAKALRIHPNSLLRLIRNLGLKGLTKAAGPGS